MRKERFIKNSITAFVLQLFSIVIAFVTRKLLIDNLGIDYAGLRGLFSNVLSLLSLSELGFSSAVTYNLYKPLAENNTEYIEALMAYYKNVYRIVACVITVFGIALSFFLPVFVGDTPLDMSFLRTVFYVYLVQTVSSYFFIYRTTLAVADQKNYIFFKYDLIIQISIAVSDIINLYFVRDFVIYLSCQTVIKITGNILKSRLTVKAYPYIAACRRRLAENDRKKVMSDVKKLFVGQLSGTLLTSTDSIIISKFLNVATIGMYENYLSVADKVLLTIYAATNSLPNAMGNISVTEARHHSEQTLQRVTTVIIVIASFCASALCCLLTPFVSLWLGDEYILGSAVVLAIAFNVFAQLMKKPLWDTLYATGMFAKINYISIIGVTVNIIVSIALVIKIGLLGVIIGTITALSLQFILRIILLYRGYYKLPMKKYVLLVAGGTLKTIVEMLALSWISGLLYRELDSAVMAFALTAVTVIIVPNLLSWLMYRKLDGFVYVRNTVRQIAGKLKNRGR